MIIYGKPTNEKKKANTLCSPTSALEKKQMLSHLGRELRDLSSG
jgi:hypothetical protein